MTDEKDYAPAVVPAVSQQAFDALKEFDAESPLGEVAEQAATDFKGLPKPVRYAIYIVAALLLLAYVVYSIVVGEFMTDVQQVIGQCGGIVGILGFVVSILHVDRTEK